MASFKVTGFDELERELEQMSNNAEQLFEGVPLQEVFNRAFMVKSTHGRFDSIDAFLLAAGGKLNPDGESWHFENDDVLDSFVSANTRFRSWELMQAAAVEKML